MELDKKQKKTFYVGAIANIIFSFMMVAIPFLTNEILEKIEDERKLLDIQAVKWFSYGIIVFCIVVMLLFIFQEYVKIQFILQTKLKIEKQFVGKILENQKNNYSYISMLNEDINDICYEHYMNLFKIISSIAFVIAVLIYSIIIDIYAFIIECIFLLCLLVIQIYGEKVISAAYHLYRNARISETNKILSFLKARRVMQYYDSKGVLYSKLTGIVSEKADLEKNYILKKELLSILYKSVPLTATLTMTSVVCFKASDAGLENVTYISSVYIVGYMLWEIIKVFRVKSEFAVLKETENELSRFFASENTVTAEKIENITLKNLSVKKDSATILKDINYKFEKNKKYLIVGKSGSGKSTLIETICGLTEYEGTINGKKSEDYSIIRDINFLPQKSEIVPGNVYYNITFHKELDNVEKAKVDSCLDMVKLVNKNDLDDCYNFSGGERKRLALARGLYHDKREFWIIDEPFEEVDKESVELFESIIIQLESAIVVSHIYSEQLIKSFDVVIIIEDGNLIFAGNYRDIPLTLSDYYNMGGVYEN